MIVNITNKNDMITMDFNLKEIRYIWNYTDSHKENIEFINLSNDDCLGYEYLYNLLKAKNLNLFFKSLKFDIKNNLNIDIDIKKLRVIP